MDRINRLAQVLFDRLFPKGTVRFLEHRDIIEKALRTVDAEREKEVEKLRAEVEGLRKRCKPEFEELTGKPIPADELSEAKKFADFDSKKQMMCGWQTVHRELHVIYTALLAVESERDAACEDARSKQERMQRVIDGSKTLAAEGVAMREALEKLRPVAPSICPLIDDALSAPATSNWSAAFESLVKEHRERRVGQFHVPLSSEMLRHKELSDAAASALADLKKGE